MNEYDILLLYRLQSDAVDREQGLADRLWQPVAKGAAAYGRDAIRLAEECRAAARTVTAAGEIRSKAC